MLNVQFHWPRCVPSQVRLALRVAGDMRGRRQKSGREPHGPSAGGVVACCLLVEGRRLQSGGSVRRRPADPRRWSCRQRLRTVQQAKWASLSGAVVMRGVVVAVLALGMIPRRVARLRVLCGRTVTGAGGG